MVTAVTSTVRRRLGLPIEGEVEPAGPATVAAATTEHRALSVVPGPGGGALGRDSGASADRAGRPRSGLRAAGPSGSVLSDAVL